MHNQKKNFENNLVQIGTGEGKSITMAVVSIVLALFGYDVSCACYSQMLSLRDYEGFKELFKNLGVLEQIKYGTFDFLCETLLNENGSIRTLMSTKVLKEKNPINPLNSHRIKVLVIDEADVFFSPQYYGKLYNPVAQIAAPEIDILIDFVWANKNNKQLSLSLIKKSRILFKM